MAPAIAQALARAGLVDKEKADKIQSQKTVLQEKYHTISEDIRFYLRDKRQVERLKEAVKGGGGMSMEDVHKNAYRLFKMPAMNYAAKVNQLMLLDATQKKLEELEGKLRPLIKESRRLEKEWGFTRDVQ